MNTITFSTNAQAALFRDEIQGQLSDGWWENDGGKAKRTLWEAEVLVGDTVGCTFYNSRRYDLTELLDIEDVANRMLEIAKTASNGIYDGMRELEFDLKTISKVMRTQIKVAA